MPGGSPNPRDYGFYLALSQIGLEMVAPLGVGIALDHYLDWAPWATIVGALLGLIGGMMHLVILVNQHNKSDSSRPRRDQQ